MRRWLIASLGALLLAALGISAADAQTRWITQGRTLSGGTTAGGSAVKADTSIAWDVSWVGGTVEIEATGADSAAADSFGFEVFVAYCFKAPGSNAACTPASLMDMNDATPYMDGYLCTSMDSTRLSAPTVLTGGSGSTSVYPGFISSRLAACQINAGPGSAIDTGDLIKTGTAANKRIFTIILGDAFGGPSFNADAFTVWILNRHLGRPISVAATFKPRLK